MLQDSRPHYVYVLQCADGSLYTGWTTNVPRRVKTHNRGKGAKYTRSRLPVTIQLIEAYETKSEALRREWEIKHMSRQQKQQLIRNQRLDS
ncbi:GIY-YIG nuclease family protein [Alicyclobacillus mengziensis]|uniref:GIY-YIG nuclease family protein n=1 Tax=Alicyclobacillus mengziensis TaxID=2931921 RepID=A0A9X7W0A9_9BACL|nr:GIY-YIG nuclease family protein [Alicyclobacillus mengziensis]QSO48082.1 GIY-YIG nuclease family protein [Alicyclobacillus mengziensis]